jgi:hypothetical protein
VGARRHRGGSHGGAALQTFDPRAQDLERQIRRVWSVYAEQPAAHERSTALSGRLQEIAAELGRAP